MAETQYNLLICSYLEPELVARIRQVNPQVNVIYEPSFLRPPRYAADHTGDPNVNRTLDQERRWQDLLAQADILFDFDYTHRAELPDLAPQVRWIQSTSAGIGQFVKRYNYDGRMPQTIFTTASGVHARPLAEFVLMAITMHLKGAALCWRNQQRKHWERYAGTDLEGRTLGLVGLGQVGSEVARLARAVGLHTVGTDVRPVHDTVDRFFSLAELDDMLPLSEFLVLTVPHTPETEEMIGARQLARLPRGAFFINIARGQVVSEADLVEALRSGHLSGAALDVFAREPLPPESPLWEMPNVMVSPHSASTSDRENQRITDLFCDNLRRYLSGERLRNVLDPQRMY